jgi:hypothetical protein
VALPPKANKLVTGLQAAKPAAAALAGTTIASTTATSTAQLVTFTGFLGDTFKFPGGQVWRLLYLDLEMERWLIVEESGIADWQQVKDEKVPGEKRDLIWVKADAAVGTGSGSQSDEARFLTGEFTRAGDFEAPLSGGTLAAATGVFCEARTPLCCTRYSK